MKQPTCIISNIQLMIAFLLISLFIPANGNAQMFGGTIKTKRATITIPSTITLGKDVSYFVASVYDNDYLPYTTPTSLATTEALAVDGTLESVVDIQGTIAVDAIAVSIPVSASSSGTLPAYNYTITVPDNMTQDGVGRDLTLSWEAQEYTSSTTAIVANLVAVGGTLNAKKLDINSGIGSDYLGVLLGSFIYPYNNSGNTSTFSVRAIAGIPDRMFGKADNGGVVRHNFLYLPVMGEDGRIWLNTNLGVDYANVDNPSFKLGQQANAFNDYHAYGSLFQWGRKPDGHELVNWTSSTTGSAVNGNTTTKSDNPNNALFITLGADWVWVTGNVQDWRVNADGTLWAAESSANNPCPNGFRPPTLTELWNWTTAAGVTNITIASNSKLKLTMPGRRDNRIGELIFQAIDCEYWTGSPYVVVDPDSYDEHKDHSSMVFFRDNVGTGDPSRMQAFPVRCIKN